MQMLNSTCITPGVGSTTFGHHAAMVGAASAMPQNILALSAFLSSLGCNSSHQQEPINTQHGDFEYLQHPISKMTDVTEASKKLVRLTEEEFLKKEVIKVGQNIYVAIGYALANSIMIEGKDGVVIIDTTESADAMLEIMEEFRKITNKPVKAIILTHFHADHIWGTNAIIDKEKKLRPGQVVEVIAHESILEQMLGFAATYDIGLKRAYRQLGALLPKIFGKMTGSGIGPFLRVEKISGVHIPLPTAIYRERKAFHIGGLEFEVIHTPGETSDQTTVWLPIERAVFPGDNIYKAFPNLYAIRGSPARDAKQWYTSIDKTRELRAVHLVGSHGRPVSGKQLVNDTLLIYRDAIKYVHDQTLRLLNKGYIPNEIVDMIRLPEKLANHPFLQQHYGMVAWAIRGIYTNYIGWFSGDPKDLHPLSVSVRAKKLMQLLSHGAVRTRDPAETLLQYAQLSHMKSYETYLKTGKHIVDDDKWALELVDILLESGSLSGSESLIHTATQIKISALRALGSEEISANGRNYYMTYAMEVESGKRHSIDTKGTKKLVIETSPVKRIIDIICSRVNGLECQHENYTVSFSFSDADATAFTVTLRNSVCDVFPGVLEPNHIHLLTTTRAFKLTTSGKIDIDEQIVEGNMKFSSGSGTLYKRFMSCFDRD